MAFVFNVFHNSLTTNTPRLLPLDIHNLLGGFEFFTLHRDHPTKKPVRTSKEIGVGL